MAYIAIEAVKVKPEDGGVEVVYEPNEDVTGMTGVLVETAILRDTDTGAEVVIEAGSSFVTPPPAEVLSSVVEELADLDIVVTFDKVPVFDLSLVDYKLNGTPTAPAALPTVVGSVMTIVVQASVIDTDVVAWSKAGVSYFDVTNNVVA